MVDVNYTVVVSGSSTGITSPWFLLDNLSNTTMIVKRNKKKAPYKVERTCQNPDKVTPTVTVTDPTLNTTVASTAAHADVVEVAYTTPYKAVRFVAVSGNTSSDTTFNFTLTQA